MNTPDPRSEALKSDAHIFWLPTTLFHILLWPFARILLLTFAKFTVTGTENLRLVHGKGTILAVNHSSEVDPVMVQYALPLLCKQVPLYFVSLTKKDYPFKKYGVRSLCYGGILFRLMGAYPVYRGIRNYELALGHHIRILNMGRSVCIFPEGKKTQTGDVGNAKPGFIYLSERTKSPIIPINMQGTFNITLKKFIARQHHIKIVIGKPIYPEDIFDGTEQPGTPQYRQKAQSVMENIGRLQ